jgi:PAS domain S-box-containing protein
MTRSWLFVLGFLWLSLLLLPSSPMTIEEMEEKLKTVDMDARIRLLGEYSREIIESHPIKSLEFTREAYRLARESGEPLNIVNALKSMGNWYLINSYYQEAIKHYLQALAFEPRIKEKNIVANLMTNVGIVYWQMESYDMAWHYHSRALTLRKKWGYTKYEMATTLNNLGLVCFAREEYPKALEFYLEALPLFKQAGFKRGVAATLNNIGELYTETGDYTRALESYNNAIPIYKEIGLKWGAAEVHMNIGIAYLRQQRYPDARRFLETALQLAKTITAKDLTYKSYGHLSELYEAQGDFANAIRYYKESTQLKNTVINERNRKQAARLEALYEVEKKNNEIQLLRKNRLIERMVIILLVVVIATILVLVAVAHNRFKARRKTARLLEMSENKYRTLFSGAGDAIFLMDQSTFVDCNEKALVMFDLKREEIIGKTFDDISPPTQPDGENSLETGLPKLEKAFNGEPQHFHWTHKKKDGSLFETVVSLSAITINQQRLMQGIVHDISHRLKLEDERIKSAKLQSIGLMAGGIAHDFNNLLCVLMASLEVAKLKSRKRENISDILANMEETLQSAARLSEKFLTFSEGGYPSKEILQVGKTIEKTMGAVLENTGKQYRLDIAEDLYPIQCDIKQIQQVLENIARNAKDFTAENGKIGVSATNVTLDTGDIPPLKAGPYIRISIDDNGGGIPEAHLSRVFDPYFSTRDQFSQKGLGMGLAIANSIVKRHGGTITVSSAVGRGSAFDIYIPAALL